MSTSLTQPYLILVLRRISNTVVLLYVDHVTDDQSHNAKAN